MSTVFFLLPESHAGLVEADELEHTLVFMLRRREVEHRSRSYWDDTEYGTEYGVRLDIDGLCDEHFERLLGELVWVTAKLYGEIRIQLGDE